MCLDHIGIQESCVILMRILSFRRARRVIRRFGGISKLVKTRYLKKNFVFVLFR
jgi:hypothetical protein